MKYIKILNEIAPKENIEFLRESVNGSDVTKIKGLFTTLNERNRNGRLYTKEIFEREVNRLQENIEKGSVLGELEHPASTSINYENAVIKIDSLKSDGKYVEGVASVIPAGKGLLIEGLIKVGAQIGISSRGTGSLSEDKTVKTDYSLVTYDLVADPSNYGSYMNAIEESKEFIIESNGDLRVAYNELDKDLEKLPSYKRKEVFEKAILSFISKL